MLDNKLLYLDNASTTKIDPEILKTYEYILEKYYANSSAIHTLGRDVNRLQEKSRQEILNMLDVKNYRLIFTASASEANNMAIKSIAIENQHLGKHLITTNVEHPSVLNSFKFLEDYMGFEVTYLDVSPDGRIDLNQLEKSLRSDTLLVSIMHVNNEVGSINDPTIWARLVKDKSKAFTHTDMVQSIGNIPLKFDNIDVATFSAHKMNGIKGSGFLIVRDYIKLCPLISGGDQEYGLRAGTSNAPANIVLSKTVRFALEKQESKALKLKTLSHYLYENLSKISEVRINSSKDNSVYTIINFSVLGVDSEIMLNALSEFNIFVSAGSTCQSDLHKRSKVLTSMSIPEAQQQSRIRVSLSADLEIEDIDTLMIAIKEIVKKYAI